LLKVNEIEEGSLILSTPALEFVSGLVKEFGPKIDELLNERKKKQARYDAGALPGFISSTVNIRLEDWAARPTPEEISDRRVEITGPVERKMIINALNSGANVFMADFEDSNSPTWKNCVLGQKNLYDAVRKQITYTNPSNGKFYELKDKTAVLFVRPRGFHLKEKNFLIDGKPIPAMLFDFGMYFYHNAQELVNRGSRPYFYLPKMESYLEARLWNDVISYSEQKMGLDVGTAKVTCLIETLPAVFQMNEIIYELRNHSVGLNCGRWDYIFNYIKTFRSDPNRVMPDRDQVGMTQHFMRCYSLLLIETCHRRRVHAMGGMAAQIPIKNDPKANELALQKVRNDKMREVLDGHDGTWVAHPGLIQIAKEVFDENMPNDNQIDKISVYNAPITEQDLICLPKGTCTMAGLKKNLDVMFKYLQSWLDGNGCVPINNLMEDAATAEISRAQVCQWLRHNTSLSDGTKVTEKLIGDLTEGLLEGVDPRRAELLASFCFQQTMDDFLTLRLYEEIN